MNMVSSCRRYISTVVVLRKRPVQGQRLGINFRSPKIPPWPPPRSHCRFSQDCPQRFLGGRREPGNLHGNLHVRLIAYDSVITLDYTRIGEGFFFWKSDQMKIHGFREKTGSLSQGGSLAVEEARGTIGRCGTPRPRQVRRIDLYYCICTALWEPELLLRPLSRERSHVGLGQPWCAFCSNTGTAPSLPI